MSMLNWYKHWSSITNVLINLFWIEIFLFLVSKFRYFVIMILPITIILEQLVIIMQCNLDFIATAPLFDKESLFLVDFLQIYFYLTFCNKDKKGKLSWAYIARRYVVRAFSSQPPITRNYTRSAINCHTMS